MIASKGTLRTVKGDATDPQKSTSNEIAIIPHVCNSINAWGAGFVMALSQKDKTPEVCYKSMFGPIPAVGGKNMLGKVSFASFGPSSFFEYGEEKRSSSKIVVANMIAQDGVIGKSDYDIPLRYSALVDCMIQVKDWIKLKESKQIQEVSFVEKRKKYVIHAPKFGSDLAGGHWPFILELIREIWLENGIDVVVYEFE